MIKAEHKKWARLLFNSYIQKELKKYFSAFYLVNKFPSVPDEKSVVITPNHISWWDGFFIDYICRKFYKRKFHIMMLEEQLKRYSFFKKLGAYSINPGSSVSIKETLKYTREILSDHKNVAVIYPQGEIEAFEKRPLIIKDGLKLFVHNTGEDVIVLPVGFKIHYYNDKLPAVITRFGDPIKGKNVIDDFNYYETKFIENLDLITKAAINRNYIADILK